MYQPLGAVLLLIGMMIAAASGALSEDGMDMYCFHCAATPWCKPEDPVDPSLPAEVSSLNEGVFLVKCEGVCYSRVLTHIAYGQKLYYRGCYQRETDCSSGCFGNNLHQDCVQCCNKNMCNGAGAVTFSLPVALICWGLARMFFK